MDSTSVSLLRQLNEPEHDAAWERFAELYARLIFHWARDRGLSVTDAADRVQEVLAIRVTKFPAGEGLVTGRERLRSSNYWFDARYSGCAAGHLLRRAHDGCRAFIGAACPMRPEWVAATAIPMLLPLTSILRSVRWVAGPTVEFVSGGARQKLLASDGWLLRIVGRFLLLMRIAAGGVSCAVIHRG